MLISSVPDCLKRLGSRFLKSDDGNVAIMLGIALVPIFAVVGVSVDYGRAASARSAMQSAADAAALMVSKEAIGLSSTDLKKKADLYVKALLNRPDLTGLTINAVYSTDSSGQSVKIDVSGAIPNSFMSMAALGNKKTTQLGTHSTVRWGARYRVALALDNTGSMASASKMTELKKAATKMIEDFAAMAKTTDDIYISIVPFAKDVNVGPTNKNESWVGWDFIGSCSRTLFQSTITNRPDCIAAGRTWTAATNNQKNNWTGCVTDRDFKRVGDHDQKNTVPNPLNPETLYDAENYADCPVPMIGMTSVFSKKQDLLNKIDAMTPEGNTNQAIGVQLAWMTHTIGQGPFPAPAKDNTMEYKDIIILFTDGDNTQNRWSTNGNTIDARQATLCSNIKSTSKIEIYTVQVATDGDAIQSVVKNCASKPDDPAYFSYVTNSTQISTKFRNIFESIARLRVSQ